MPKIYSILLLFFIPIHCMQLSQEELDNKLFDAIEENASLEEMRTLINSGANVNAKNSYGYTPLFLILENKYHYMQDVSDKVFLILESGVELCQIRLGYTAFHYAAYNNDLDMCLALIEYSKKRDLGVKVAKTLLLMKKIFPKKIPFPKPIIFLILNTIEKSLKPFPFKEQHQFLHQILEKKTNVCLDEEFDNKMAYELSQLGLKRFFPNDLYWENRNNYLEDGFDFKEEKRKLEVRAQEIKELLNPVKY